jgi:hypothetical protein
MRHLTIATAVFAALALPSLAAAKGPVALEVCGASSCETFRWTQRADDPHADLVLGVLNHDVLEFASAPKPAPYYGLELQADWLENVVMERKLFYVPTASVLRAGTNWLEVDEELDAALQAATQRLAPWPRPTLTRVLVNGRRAPIPQAYEALLGELPPGQAAPTLGRQIEIVLRADRASPWTSVPRPLDYYPRVNLLHRYVEWFKVPPALAAVIERDAGIVAAAGPSRSPWPGYLAATFLGLGLVAVVALNARSRRHVRRDAEQAHATERPPEPAG